MAEIGERIGRWEIVGLLAYQGKAGCESSLCRRRYYPETETWGECMGWHCAKCDEPSGEQGHGSCRSSEAGSPT